MNKKPLFVLIAVVLGAAVPGCIGLVLEGIHFKQPNADFGLPPPRFAVTDGDGFEKNEPWRPGTQYFLGNYDNFDSRYDRAQKLPGVAFKAERLGEYSAALAAWREEIHRFWGRNELPGRIMVLRYLAKHPLEKGGEGANLPHSHPLENRRLYRLRRWFRKVCGLMWITSRR